MSSCVFLGACGHTCVQLERSFANRPKESASTTEVPKSHCPLCQIVPSAAAGLLATAGGAAAASAPAFSPAPSHCWLSHLMGHSGSEAVPCCALNLPQRECETSFPMLCLGLSSPAICGGRGDPALATLPVMLQKVDNV